jgi:hypothetical protein
VNRKKQQAMQQAFERGQQDYRDGKHESDNPYPAASPYYDQWYQGYLIESELKDK